MSADLIIYGIIAAGLVFWLRSLLGTRHGDERQRSNPYLGPVESSIDTPKDQPLIDLEIFTGADERITQLAENPTESLSLKDKSAEEGLLEIAKVDKQFDIKDFLSKAQDAFAFIVEAYAENDLETLKELTGSDVYKAFEKGIKDREKRKEKQVCEVQAVRKTEVLEARVDNKVAFVTLRFAASQISATYDSEEQLISGYPDKALEMVDIWVFSRDLSVAEPIWLLVETRSDDPDDNDIIPNTD